MKSTFATLVLLLHSLLPHAHGVGIPNPNVHKRASKPLGLPSNGLAKNCIAIGFLPSDGSSQSPPYTMAKINSALALPGGASTYGRYAQITSAASFSGDQLLSQLSDIKASGAVFVASVMPSIPFSSVTSTTANAVAAVLKKFTDEGIHVWLRFAHEMNWYVQDGTYHGSPSEFLSAWKTMYAANCAGNEMVSCFWSPNCASASSLQAWWPGPETVDIVGVDCYPKTINTNAFETAYGDFYNTFSKPHGLPFAIGETGAGGGDRETWLKMLVAKEMKQKYPDYVSLSWFEFDKEADFRIVMGDSGTLGQTKSVLAQAEGDVTCGGAQQLPTSKSAVGVPSKSGVVGPTPVKSSPAKPTATACDWGCWGWDCSAKVPCQSPWTCKGGYCK
ncbi:glycoside hydrolase superfamily [Clohesyomyces aquaticus]|uniref:Glycoside hydrolase superfamily n=1 Tax=Clohesyomyces aquaticus TaxID=1231657 RepID=A0A1Y1ZL22_9PLEO|nr:glycoside hydrolase superfamily [Clohesyomyces aquaticus]